MHFCSENFLPNIYLLHSTSKGIPSRFFLSKRHSTIFLPNFQVFPFETKGFTLKSIKGKMVLPTPYRIFIHCYWGKIVSFSERSLKKGSESLSICSENFLPNSNRCHSVTNSKNFVQKTSYRILILMESLPIHVESCRNVVNLFRKLPTEF